MVAAAVDDDLDVVSQGLGPRLKSLRLIEGNEPVVAGGMLLDALIDAARARGDGSVVLSAQSYVIDFYARHGFVTRGEPYDDCGIPHQTMHRALR